MSKSSSDGIAILGLLGVAFVVLGRYIIIVDLKLTKVIDWSWWYVTVPLLLVFYFIYEIITAPKKNKQKD